MHELDAIVSDYQKLLREKTDDYPPIVTNRQGYDAKIASSKVKKLLNRFVKKNINDSLTLLFDEKFYEKNNPDILSFKHSSLKHFMDFGIYERRNPSVYFDNKYYLEQLGAGDLGEMAPLEHFLKHGNEQVLNPIEEFDSEWYLDQYAHSHQITGLAILHYLRDGWRAGLRPNPDFDTEWYLSENPEVRDRGDDPFKHYLEYGRFQGRSPHPRYLDSAPHEIIASQVFEIQKTLSSTTNHVNVISANFNADRLINSIGISVLAAAEICNQSGFTLRLIGIDNSPLHRSDLIEFLNDNGIFLKSPFVTIDLASIVNKSYGFLASERDLYFSDSAIDLSLLTAGVQNQYLFYVRSSDELEYSPIGERQVQLIDLLQQEKYQTFFWESSAESDLEVKENSRQSQPLRFIGCLDSNEMEENRHLEKTAMSRITVVASPGNEMSFFRSIIWAVDKAKSQQEALSRNFEVHIVGEDIPLIRFSDGSYAKSHVLHLWSDFKQIFRHSDLVIFADAANGMMGLKAALARIGVPVLALDVDYRNSLFPELLMRIESEVVTAILRDESRNSRSFLPSQLDFANLVELALRK